MLVINDDYMIVQVHGILSVNAAEQHMKPYEVDSFKADRKTENPIIFSGLVQTWNIFKLCNTLFLFWLWLGVILYSRDPTGWCIYAILGQCFVITISLFIVTLLNLLISYTCWYHTYGGVSLFELKSIDKTTLWNHLSLLQWQSYHFTSAIWRIICKYNDLLGFHFDRCFPS